MDIHNRTEVVQEAAKASPALLVAVPTVLGYDWNTVVLALTAAYIVLQMAYLLYRWYRRVLHDVAGEKGEDE